ncbi:MAG TPA: hypothetical protein VGR37_01170 [Longimicrobiaceae bacterium]|nr:hypothetical protein [Longimicrobiaceae bacterium]
MSDLDPTDDRVRLDLQLLYDRSRTSAFDLLKLLVTLATAGVGTYFFTLTGKLEPAITPGERTTALLALILLGAAAFAGLLAWGADARFYERWAQSLQKEDGKGLRWRSRNRANMVRRYLLGLAILLFVAGLLVSGAFAFLRSGRIVQ